MATLIRSNGAKHETVKNVDLGKIDAKLRALGHCDEFTRTGKLPTFEPVMASYSYFMLQVFDSEPKTNRFAESGFYYLKGLDEKADLRDYVLAAPDVEGQKRNYYAGPDRKIGGRMAHKVTDLLDSATKFGTAKDAEAMSKELGGGYRVVPVEDQK